MTTTDWEWQYGVQPAEGVQFQDRLDDWSALAAVVIVEPDWNTWLWGDICATIAGQLDQQLSEQLEETMNMIYVMSAARVGALRPLFPEMWDIALAHARGWGQPDEEALRQLRRWLGGLSTERGGDQTAPVAIIGAVLEDDVLRAANAVVQAGWPAVVVEGACLTESCFCNLDRALAPLRRQVKRLMKRAESKTC